MNHYTLKVSGLLIILFLLSSIMYSCEDESDYLLKENLNTLIKNENFKVNNYDKRMEHMARSLAASLSNKDLRKMFKERALEQWDGDYEFLYKNVKETRFGNENRKVKEIISNNFDANDDDLKAELRTYNKGNTQNTENLKGVNLKEYYLDKFSEDFPSLQIAVRGPVEKWDADNFQPLVVYVPSDFKEEWKEIAAFDKTGRIVMLDLTKEVEQPFIVIMKSERTDNAGELLEVFKGKHLENEAIPVSEAFNALNSTITSEPDACVTPPTPTNLTGLATNNGIYLSWIFPNVAFDGWKFFEIQKFINNQWVTIYVDHISTTSIMTQFDLVALSDNLYRVMARYSSKQGRCYSAYSNTINVRALGTPSPLTELNSFCTAPGQFLLDWQIPAEYQTGFRIERYIPGKDTDWVHVTTKSNTTASYFYKDTYLESKPGILARFRVAPINTYGHTSKETVAYSAIRRNGDPLYVTHIAVGDMSKIESQIYGKPELYFTTVSMKDDISSDATTIWNKVDIGYPNRLPIATLNKKIIGQWYNEFYRNVIGISIVEYDGEWLSANLNINVTAQKAVKTKDGTSINVEAKGGITLNYKQSDKDCGINYYMYWGNSGRLDFGNTVSIYIDNKAAY